MTTSGDDQRAAAMPGSKAEQEWEPGKPLEPSEQALLDHTRAGALLDLVGDSPVNHRAMEEWGPQQTVRATVLRHLLVEAHWRIHTKGVQVRGARISGRLDLGSATVRCPLLLEDCYFDNPNPIALDYAAAPRLTLSRCRIAGGISADRVMVTKEVDLSGSTFEGPVLLRDAEITGRLSFRGAQLTGTDANSGEALGGEGLKVGGDVLLDEGFSAAGGVLLRYADITGRLSCRNANLTGTDLDGDTLIALGLKVGDGVVLDQVAAKGAVHLSNADISGPLACRDANLASANVYGDALVGLGMKVDGGVFLDQVAAAGAVLLRDAEITGRLSFRGAQLTGTDANSGEALGGEGLKVGGDVLLDEGFTAAGAVVLSGARIGGSLRLSGAELAEPVALKAEGVQVGGQLQWAPRSPVRGLVDLERAAVNRLDDDWSLPDAHWPKAGQLRLAGFIYSGLGGGYQGSWRQRLDWIRRSHMSADMTTPGTFATQPYEQLEHVYRQAGQYASAARIRTARFEDLRRYGSLTRRERLGNHLLGKLFGYGYQPMRAVAWLVGVYAAVLLVAWGAQHHDSVIVPAKDIKSITPAPTALHCSPGYPCFYPAGYAIDVAIPIINLRQAENWRPNGDAPWGWAYIAVGWVATGLGWAFTTIAVVAYTGLVRKD